MELWKPSKPCGPAATEAQQQPPQCGSTESQDISAWSQAPSAPRRASSSSRTSTSSTTSMSSRTSTSSRSTKSSKKSTSSRTYKHAVCRKDVLKADKATQTPCCFKVLRKEWQPRGKKKKNKYMRDGQDQPQQRVSRASSATESCSQTLQHRAPSPPEAAVIPQNRKSVSRLCMNMYNEEGEEQDEAVRELEGKRVDVREVVSHLLPVEIHLLDQNHQEALEDVAVDGDTVNIQDPDSNVGTMEVPLASEELQEAPGDTREGTASVGNLGFDLAMVETHLTPEPQEVPSLAAVDGVSLAALSLSLPRPEISPESQSLLLARCPAPFKHCPGPTAGYKGDTQDLNSILGSVASEAHLTSKEKLEALGDVEDKANGKVNLSESMKVVRTVQQPPLGEEDTVDVISEDSILATPRIHSNPEELKEAKVNERIAPSPGCAPKTSVKPKPLPKKRVIKPLPRETTRDLSHILQQRIECKAAKNMTRKQRKAHGKNDSDSFHSVHARGILFFEVFLKLVELAALPQRTLFQIISYYQQKLRDCAGQKVWMDGDFKCRKKKPHKVRKEPVYPMPSFVSAACVSAKNKREAAAYVEDLKGSPYAQVPIFPLISKQDATTLAKPKTCLQKVARQSNEPTASLRSHIFHDRNRVQEAAALKPPAHHRKQRGSPAINTKRSNTHRLTTASLGKTQVQQAQAAQQHRHSPALRQRRSLLKLWQKIGLQAGSERFHHTFCTYSWSWNACRELVTVTDLHRVNRQLHHRRRPARWGMAAGTRRRPCLDGTGGR